MRPDTSLQRVESDMAELGRAYKETHTHIAITLMESALAGAQYTGELVNLPSTILLNIGFLFL